MGTTTTPNLGLIKPDGNEPGDNWPTQHASNADTIDGLLVPGSIDFETAFDGINTGFSGSFTDVISFTYTPPASWNTYKLMAVGFFSIKKSTSNVNIDSRLVINGVNKATNNQNNNASTFMFTSANATESGLSGNITIAGQLRQNPGSSSNSDTGSWINVIAVRLT